MQINHHQQDPFIQPTTNVDSVKFELSLPHSHTTPIFVCSLCYSNTCGECCREHKCHKEDSKIENIEQAIKSARMSNIIDQISERNASEDSSESSLRKYLTQQREIVKYQILEHARQQMMRHVQQMWNQLEQEIDIDMIAETFECNLKKQNREDFRDFDLRIIQDNLQSDFDELLISVYKRIINSRLDECQRQPIPNQTPQKQQLQQNGIHDQLNKEPDVASESKDDVNLQVKNDEENDFKDYSPSNSQTHSDHSQSQDQSSSCLNCDIERSELDDEAIHQKRIDFIRMMMQTEQKIYYISDDDDKDIRQVHVSDKSNLNQLKSKYRVKNNNRKEEVKNQRVQETQEEQKEPLANQLQIATTLGKRRERELQQKQLNQQLRMRQSGPKNSTNNNNQTQNNQKTLRYNKHKNQQEQVPISISSDSQDELMEDESEEVEVQVYEQIPARNYSHLANHNANQITQISQDALKKSTMIPQNSQDDLESSNNPQSIKFNSPTLSQKKRSTQQILQAQKQWSKHSSKSLVEAEAKAFQFDSRMLFYFKGIELKMVDLNMKNRIRQEYEMFFNRGKISKNKDGFSIFKLTIPNPITGEEEQHIIILGINKQCTRVVRYDEKKDEIQEIGAFYLPTYRSKPIELAFYSASVYKDSEIYVTGVLNTMVQTYRTNFKISFEIDLSGLLQINFEDFPQNIDHRRDHVSFILDGYLIVGLGDKDYFEYLDLEEYQQNKFTEGYQPEFTKIPATDMNKTFLNVVTFQNEELCKQTGEQFDPNLFYFFGHTQQRSLRRSITTNSNLTSKLYSFRVEWGDKPIEHSSESQSQNSNEEDSDSDKSGKNQSNNQDYQISMEFIQNQKTEKKKLKWNQRMENSGRLGYVNEDDDQDSQKDGQNSKSSQNGKEEKQPKEEEKSSTQMVQVDLLANMESSGLMSTEVNNIHEANNQQNNQNGSKILEEVQRKKVPIFVQIQEIETKGLIPGNPRFSQRLQNKYYNPELKKWIFMDEKGELFTFYPEELKISNEDYKLEF
eukprot:403367963